MSTVKSIKSPALRLNFLRKMLDPNEEIYHLMNIQCDFTDPKQNIEKKGTRQGIRDEIKTALSEIIMAELHKKSKYVNSNSAKYPDQVLKALYIHQISQLIKELSIEIQQYKYNKLNITAHRETQIKDIHDAINSCLNTLNNSEPFSSDTLHKALYHLLKEVNNIAGLAQTNHKDQFFRKKPTSDLADRLNNALSKVDPEKLILKKQLTFVSSENVENSNNQLSFVKKI